MASATFCYLESIIAVIKVVIEHEFFRHENPYTF